MSSKSTILLTRNNEHIFEDVFDARYVNGVFVGYDITFEIMPDSIKQHYIGADGLIVILNECELSSIFGTTLTIPGDDIEEFEVDKYGLYITIIGGTSTAKWILSKRTK